MQGEPNMKHQRTAKISCGICLFLLGGMLYNFIEILWRGRTHWSMFLVGGVCFRLIGKIYSVFSKINLFARCLLSSVAVTAVEFLSGCYFNLHLKLEVWNYAGRPLNICGQVCLLYSFFWGILSIPAGLLHTCFEKGLTRIGRRIYFSVEGHR